MSDDIKNQATESTPRKTPVSQEDLVASLAGKIEAESDETTRKVTTSEAATRTDNNDRDALGQQLEEVVKANKSTSDDADEMEEESGDAEDEVEATEEPAEEVEDDEEAEEEGDEESEDDSIDPDDEVAFVTEDGTEVTLRELKRGFLREQDYTRKTQEIAEQRQKLQQQAQAFEAHNSTVAEHLNMALDILEPSLAELASTNWSQLASADPYEYAEKRALFDQAQHRYAQLKQAAQQTIQEAQVVAEAKKKQYLAQQQQKLQMALPELADKKTGPKLAQSIREYAMKVGLTKEEASNITDHRMVVMLNKARMFDELSSSKLSLAKKKVSKAPKKAVRSGNPSSKAERQQESRAQKRARVKQTGSVDSLVELLMSQS